MITEFQKRVFNIVKKIPCGEAMTYKEVAGWLGDLGAARAVGNALNRNFNPNVPCHRVIKSDGSVGGFRGGTEKKIAILRREGVKIKNGKIVPPFLKGG